MACLTGQRGGFHALAAYVSERDDPVVLVTGDVVEVATDVEMLGGGSVARTQVHAGDVGKSRRPQALLQDGGQPGLLLVEPGRVQRQRSPSGDPLGECDVVR